jgi:hypothetical protein
VHYAFDSSDRTASAQIALPMIAYEGELMVTRTVGLGFHGFYAGEGGFVAQRFDPFFGWHISPRVRVLWHFGVGNHELRDDDAVGGVLESSGQHAFGVGVSANW